MQIKIKTAKPDPKHFQIVKVNVCKVSSKSRTLLLKYESLVQFSPDLISLPGDESETQEASNH